MEENKFDPLQFIGFLLISGILMFWFYDNQSNLIESQEAIVDDTNVQAVEQPSNNIDSNYNDYQENDEFNEEIIVLENSNILLEISTKGADIKKLLLKNLMITHFFLIKIRLAYYLLILEPLMALTIGL